MTLSLEIFEKSCEVIPSGVNSPVRSFPGLERNPIMVERGEGAELIDVDGRRYIDYCCSWGAMIHGHAHPQIVEAATAQIARGSTFGTATPSEERLARKVCEMVPSIEKVRFVSSGTEATMTALRLARGFTRRDVVIKFTGNYHGHADPFLAKAGSGVSQFNTDSSSAGVPADVVKDTYSLTYNNLEEVQAVFEREGERIAAVILEPIAGNMGLVPARPEFLALLRELTQAHGALLIFDEVMTGFRVARGCAQELYGITPDLTCLGKVVGGGFPAAALGGRRDILDHLSPNGPVYQAGTLSGNPVAMEAGYAALSLLDDTFYTQLAEKTEAITAPIRDCIKRTELNACVQSVPGMFTLFFGARQVTHFSTTLDIPLYNRFFHHLFDQGIYWVPSQYEANFLSAAHTRDQIEFTLASVIEFLESSMLD